jgi:pilus assembly protein Flp/PilA
MDQMNLVTRFLRDRSGATAIEYCLIAMLIGTVIVAVVTAIGGSLNEKFTSVRGGFTP